MINPFIHFPFKAPRTAFAFTLPPANAMTGFFESRCGGMLVSFS